MKMAKIKIGMLGAGGISSRVAAGIKQSENCELARVCSRDINKAKKLAEAFSVPDFSDDYSDLFKDDIDAVYIVTVNKMHYEHIKLCLANKKHVICEKPMLSDKTEIDELYDLAQHNNVMLLEAMKCRYLPTLAKVKELLKDYPYPQTLSATFCRNEPHNQDYNGNFYDVKYSGAMKDIGCYVYSWAMELFPEATVDSSLQRSLSHGVDTDAWLYLKNDKGLYMQLGCSVIYDCENVGLITGDNYQISVRDFWKTCEIEVRQGNRLSASFKEDIGSEFAYQVDFFGATIKKAAWNEVNQREREFLKRIVDFYPTSM